MRKNSMRRRRWVLIGMTLLLTFAAFTVRTLVYQRESKTISRDIGADFVPFDRESAIMYNYALRVADGRGIPTFDPGLGGMEKVSVASQMFLGMEYFLGWGYRIKKLFFGMPEYTAEDRVYEDNPDFTAFARIQIRAWISLVAGLIFLWLLVLRVRFRLAAAAALIYVVSPAAIARYTGQDLVRGEFCMPFIVLSLLLAASILRRPAAYKYFWLAAAVFCSFAFWDGSQMLFSVWALFELTRTVWSGHASRKRQAMWLVIFCAEVLAAVLVPYQRYHGLILSPVTLIVLPSVLAVLAVANRVDRHYFSRRSVLLLLRQGWWRRIASKRVIGYLLGRIGGWLRVQAANLDRMRRWHKRLTLVAVIMAVLGLIWLLLPGFSHNYGHFGKLLVAKLLFFNVKPTDPTQLNFDARILWTPAMHSANWMMTMIFYPAALGLSALILAGMMAFRAGRRRLRHDFPRLFLPLVLTVFFFFFYILIVRVHVFCAIFLCVLFGLALDNLNRVLPRRRWRGWVLLALAVLALYGEASTTRAIRRDYPPGTFRDVATLIKWLRSVDAEGVTVLTDMTLSPVLKGYCGVRILTQPKFELKTVRDLVEEQIHLMFWGNEKKLGDFCRKYRVDLVIFDRGNSYEAPMPIYSVRYMAAAREIRRDAPAWFMDKRPERLETFYLVTLPGMTFKKKYPFYVFRYVDPAEKAKAEKAADLAQYFFDSGRPATARRMVANAHAAAPNSEKVYIAYYKIWGKTPDDAVTSLVKSRKGEYDKLAIDYRPPSKKRRVIINGIDYSNEKLGE